jgi:transposase
MNKPRKVTAEQWVEILNVYREGGHLPTVASKYNITVSYIYNFVKLLSERGIKVPRGKTKRDSVLNKVIQLSNEKTKD